MFWKMLSEKDTKTLPSVPLERFVCELKQIYLGKSYESPGKKNLA